MADYDKGKHAWFSEHQYDLGCSLNSWEVEGGKIVQATSITREKEGALLRVKDKTYLGRIVRHVSTDRKGRHG